MQKGLPIDRKYGIVEWYGIILVLYSDKGVLSGTLFYEQLAADVREAGENPARSATVSGSAMQMPLEFYDSGKAHGIR